MQLDLASHKCHRKHRRRYILLFLFHYELWSNILAEL